MPEVCAWHKSPDCLDKTGVLVLSQSQSAPADREEFERALQATDIAFGTERGVIFLQQMGTFCTTSALLSWLEAETGAMRQTTSELHGKGPGARRGKGNQQRPTVTREGRRRQR